MKSSLDLSIGVSDKAPADATTSPYALSDAMRLVLRRAYELRSDVLRDVWTTRARQAVREARGLREGSRRTIASAHRIVAEVRETVMSR